METHSFAIPLELNGDQLQEETGAESVRVSGDELLIVSDKTKAEIAAIVAAHIPAPFVQPTVTEKLASVGLSVDDLKTALGL
jgi:hypothetical protein